MQWAKLIGASRWTQLLASLVVSLFFTLPLFDGHLMVIWWSFYWLVPYTLRIRSIASIALYRYVSMLRIKPYSTNESFYEVKWWVHQAAPKVFTKLSLIFLSYPFSKQCFVLLCFAFPIILFVASYNFPSIFSVCVSVLSFLWVSFSLTFLLLPLHSEAMWRLQSNPAQAWRLCRQAQRCA